MEKIIDIFLENIRKKLREQEDVILIVDGEERKGMSCYRIQLGGKE